MSLTADTKEQAQRMLDGMTVNRDQFARNVLIVVGEHEKLVLAHIRQQTEIARLKALADQYDEKLKKANADLASAQNPWNNFRR